MSFFVAAVVVTAGTAVYVSEEKKKAEKKAAAAEAARKKNLADAVAAKETEYGNLATNYNTAVTNYNNNLTNYTSGLTGIGNTLGGLDIGSLWDDPNTAENENQYDNLMGQLNTIETNLNNLKFDATRPSFSSSLTTEFGTGTVNVPTLNNANTSALSGYLDTIDSYQSQLNNLNRDRTKEESRIKNFQNDLDYSLGQLDKNIGRLDISQNKLLDEYEDDLGKLGTDYKKFSSSILDQVGGLNYDDSGLKNSIKGLRDARTAEEKRISDFNASLGTTASGYADQLSGYDIRNLDELNALQKNIDAQQSSAKNFSSLLNFDFGSNLDALGQTESGVQNLLNARNQELDRISLAEAEALRRAKGLDRAAAGYGIADLDYITDTGYDIQDYNSDIGSFSSLLDYDFSGANQYATSAQNRIDQLLADRATEETRISNYGNTLANLADQYEADLSGYNIANIDEMNALQALIDAQQKDARGFTSELDFDFRNQLNELQDVEDNLGNLYLERQLEQGRIEDAQANYLRQAQGIDRLADSTGIYGKAGIDALQQELDALNTDIGGFSSLLDYDFSNTDQYRTQAAEDIAGLYSERASALDEIQNPIAGLTDQLGGLELYDESGMRNIRGDLSALNQDLSRFSGGRVDEIQGQITGGLDAVDARLADLTTYRGQLEEKAQGLMDAVNGNTYYAVNDLTGDLEEYDAQRAEIELYNAQVAMDEIDSVMERLYGERNRLEQDAQNVQARQSSAQSALLNALNAFGLPQFDNLSQVDPQTMAQFMAMLQSGNDEEDQFTTNPNAFSSNVIRVG